MSNFNRREHRIIKKRRSKKVLGDLQKPRVIISKSNRYLTAQAVDDISQKTLLYICTKNLKIVGKNFKSKIAAEVLGEAFASSLLKSDIDKIVFDRNGYIYHGKIKTFCEKMRKLGIIF